MDAFRVLPTFEHDHSDDAHVREPYREGVVRVAAFSLHPFHAGRKQTMIRLGVALPSQQDR
jgi:hypothetical protein